MRRRRKIVVLFFVICVLIIFAVRLLSPRTVEEKIEYIYLPTEFDFLYDYYSSDNVTEIRQYLRNYLLKFSSTGDVALLDYMIDEDLTEIKFSFAEQEFITYVYKAYNKIGIEILHDKEKAIITKFMLYVKCSMYEKAYSMLYSEYPMSYESFVKWFDVEKELRYTTYDVSIKNDIPYATIHYWYEENSYFILNCYLKEENSEYKLYFDNLV